MKLTLILLICGFACCLAFQRGGSRVQSRPHNGGGVRKFHSAPKISRPPPRAAPRPHSRPIVHVKPAVRAPPRHNLPKAVPKPRPVVIAKPLRINPPKAVPKPQAKPVVIAKPPPKPAPKPVVIAKPPPKPAPKPVVIAKPPPKPAPKPVVIAKPPPKPAPKPVVIAKPPPVTKAVPKPPIAAKPAPTPKAVPKPVVIAKPPSPPAHPPKPATKSQVKPAAIAKPPPANAPKAVAKPPAIAKATAVNPPKAAPKPAVKPAVVAKTPPAKPLPKAVPKSPVKPAAVSKTTTANTLPKTTKQQTKPAVAVKTPPVKPLPKMDLKTPVKPTPKDTTKTQITGSVTNSPGKGSDLKLDAKQNVWKSQNERHSIDATAGVTRHLGGPDGNTKPDVRVGAEYSYNSPKTQITASASGKPKSLDLNVNAQQNIWQSKNERHSIDALGSVSKQADSKKLDSTIGAQYNYNGPKTQITGSAVGGPSGKGVDLNVDAQHNLWQSKDQRHSIDAIGGVSKHVGGLEGNTKTDLSLGGQYKFEDPKTKITASAIGGPDKGVKLNLDAERKLWESNNKRSSIGITGGVSQQLGGPNGGGKPDANVGVKFSTDF